MGLASEVLKTYKNEEQGDESSPTKRTRTLLNKLVKRFPNKAELSEVVIEIIDIAIMDQKVAKVVADLISTRLEM